MHDRLSPPFDAFKSAEDDDFDEREYLRLNPDVAAACAKGIATSGAAHWRDHGRSEGRRWNLDFDERELPLDFDEDDYVQAYPDVVSVLEALQISPAEHWILHGKRSGRRRWIEIKPETLPADFDENAFLAERPDVADLVAGLRYRSGASFWLATHGTRTPKPRLQRRPVKTMPRDLLRNGFDAIAYRDRNPDVGRHCGDDFERLADHWLENGFLEGRTAFGLKPYADRHFGGGFWSRKNEITCYGFFDAVSGLGTASRNYRDALRNAGFKVTSITIFEGDKRFETKPDVGIGRGGCGLSSRNKVNVFFLNADVVHRFFIDGRQHLLDDSYNIAVWYWELAHFRPDWANSFGAFDEIWVTTEFCRRSISASSPIPVNVLPQTVSLDPNLPKLSRSRFRIPEDVFVFGTIFDVSSVVDRKNPIAAIRAFKAAFGERDDVMLVLKYHSGHHYPADIVDLHSEAGAARNIRFFGQHFDEAENLSFKDALDCLVSPHRSEGFGLNIAEAMLFGKPVVTTDYGGSTDFVDERTGYPVRYKLVDVGRPVGPYPANALWADCDIDHLTERMLEVFDDREEAAARGQRGHDRIEALFGAEVSGRKLREHFDALEVFDAPPSFLRSRFAGASSTLEHHRAQPITFSIVVPVYNIAADLLEKCVSSVINQTYPTWEMILHDDGSTKDDTLRMLASLQGRDARIKVSLGAPNGGIAVATNAAIALSCGEFVALLDNDDELSPDALQEMAAAIAKAGDADLLYSDEDKIETDGRYSDHYFKPDWSPEHLESVMYLLHFLVVRRSVLLEIGGFRPAYSGAQDYDLALRASRVARRIVHVPKVLYHWRKIPGSASEIVDAKPDALVRAADALQDHLDHVRPGAMVESGLATGLFRVRDKVGPDYPVTLVIFTDNRSGDVPGRGRINLFDHFVASIFEKTRTRCDLRILAVDNGNLTDGQVKSLRVRGGRVVSYKETGPRFNFARKANFAFSHVATDLFVLLNDDMEIITPDWVDALVELAQRPTTGLVGARLLFPDDSIQHCGVVLGIQNNVAHAYHRQMANGIGYNAYTHVIRNYLAVTGACMAGKISLVDEIGGFDEALGVDYNDIDFCLRAYTAGYRNIYTPFAALYHFESMTAVRTAANPVEQALFTRRWSDLLANDPFYNPNLSRITPDFAPADLSRYR